MNINSKILVSFFFFISVLNAQEEKVTDSISTQNLDEVVITGQINPQSIDKSVFEVKVIGRREIEKRAGVNLADLLNQTLNLNVTPNLNSGRSNFTLFGLDGQYVKILVDNVPFINEQGFGNGADLTLINLNDVERVEIVEGSMGVQYGANAVAGVINIITKKSTRDETEVSLYFQEETVGSEFGLFEEGRHIQSFNARHYFNDKLYTSIGAVRNDFAGLFNDRLGQSHDQNDGRRGHIWLPKTQINPNILINYNNDKNFSIFYRLDYFNEILNNYNNSVNPNTNPATETDDPTAQDAEFTANRFIHTINAIGKLNQKMNYNIITSYQTQRNDVENYTYVIREDRRKNSVKQEYLSRNAFFVRATLGNIFKTERLNLQAGYEMSLEEGFSDGSAIGVIQSEDTFDRRLNTYDAFLSSEYKFSDKFSIKPGIRTSFTNLFGPQFIVSLSSSLKFGNDFSLRTVVGSANKTPTFDELFTFFVDSNHNFQGNPNLNPERGFTISAHLNKKFKFENSLNLDSKFGITYLDLEDRIEFVNISLAPLVSTFLNIDEYRAINLNFTNEVKYKRFSGQLGVALQGLSQVLNAETNADNSFLFNFFSNLNMNYSIPKWNSNITLYYKYVGRVQQFLSDIDDNGEQFFRIGETEAFSWLDLNLEKAFFDKKFVATLGARNLLDVDFSATNALPGGAHSDAPVAVPLAYGRSFFLRLNYNFIQ